MADLRIRELQTDTGLINLDWEFPLDKAGLIAAEKRTFQQAVNTVNANRDLQQVLTGAVNPDNALGNNGDTYYKYVAGTSFGVWFKTSDVWDLLFTISLSGIAQIEISASADVNGEYDASGDGLPEFPNVTIYDLAGNVSTATFNNTTKIISFLVPSEAFTAKFI